MFCSFSFHFQPKVIHTSVNVLGLPMPIGHADFYPNGGKGMPGCSGINLPGISNIIGRCDHARAFAYFREAIRGSLFYAVQCRSFNELRKGICDVISHKIRMAFESRLSKEQK